MSEDQLATEDVATPENDRMLTAQEVATRLSVHVSTVYRMGPRLNAQRFGEGKIRPRGFRIAESKLSALLTDLQDAA